MPFTDRFELLSLKRDEGVRTFEAREIASGRPVLVHLFADSTSPLNRVMLAKLDALPVNERSRIIDRGDHEGGVYVVTDRLAEYAGLREWLAQKPAKASVDDQLAHLFDTAPTPVLEPSPTAPAPAPILSNTGEQTAQMKAVDLSKPLEFRASPVTTAPPAPVAPVPAVAPPPPAAEPGEFTQLLRPISTAAPTPPAAPAANEPGEFTRQFAPVLRPVPPPSQPAAPTPSAPSPAAPAANEPGEFTRQFAPVLRPVSPPSQAPAPTPPAANEPGEFTRQFAPILRPTPTPAPQPTAPAPKTEQPMGEFTRQFQAPLRPITSTPPRTPPSAPSAPAASGDGEFTQMLRSQPPSAAAPPSAQASKPTDFENYFQSPMPVAPVGSTQQFRPMTAPNMPPKRPGREGEFTQVFGPGAVGAPPPPPVPPPSGNATNVFQAATPQAPSFTPGVNFPPPGPAQSFGAGPAQNPLQGSDEWGSMFGGSAQITFGQPPPQASRMAEAALANLNSGRNSSRLPLLLIIVAVVLLVAAVIVYLVMRPH
ncbi:MAG: hypothetical protein ABSF22_21900 [Bryobacteraceae bacterium]